MTQKIKKIKNWWLLTITGALITLLGFWVYRNPAENYLALSIMFSIMIFISGIFETTFALSNTSKINGWVWMLIYGIIDLVIGSWLITSENLTMKLLPLIFGIWLFFKGASQISRGISLKKIGVLYWWFPLLGGFIISALGFMVIWSPNLGVEMIVLFTSLTLILLGLFTISISFLIKKIQEYI